MVLYAISLVGCFRDAEIDREKKRKATLTFLWTCLKGSLLATSEKILPA